VQTVADFLVAGMGLPALECPPQACDGVCAMTGERLTAGYPTATALSDATGGFLDLLPAGNTGWVSENVARALKGMWNAGSVAVFENGTYYHPLLSRESAEKQNRPWWSALVRQVWPERAGQRCVLILADDYKKRVWPRAEVGTLEKHTAIYVHAGEASSVLYVDWDWLAALLGEVERIARECQAALGKTWRMATYRGIAESMYEQSLVRALGASRVTELERWLRGKRESPEFTVVRTIFQ
jgi:hypothetical protein